MFVQDNNNPPVNNQSQPVVDQPAGNDSQVSQNQDYVASYQPPAQSVQPVQPVLPIGEVQPPVKPVTVDEITAPKQVQALVDGAVSEAVQTTLVEQPVTPPTELPPQPIDLDQATQTTQTSQPASADVSALDELEKVIAEQQNNKDSQVVSQGPDVANEPTVAPADEPKSTEVAPPSLPTMSEEIKAETEEAILPSPAIPDKPSESAQVQQLEPKPVVVTQPADPIKSAPSIKPIEPTQVSQDQSPATREPETLPEKLEDQNIFFLLGVEDGKSDEKEKFLDELQQVIWEDFLENDLSLLITSDEKQVADKVLAQTDLSDLEKQEKLIEHLAGLIPDLEAIMLEKALELKQDLVKERVAGMKEYYKDKPADLTKIDEAAQFFAQGKWMSGAKVLNALT